MSKAEGLERDEHEIGHGNTGLDQIDLGGAGVDEHKVPTLAQKQLDRLGRRADFDQLGVVGLAAPRPPAGQAFLRIEIQQGDALGSLGGSSRGRSSAQRRLSGTTLGAGQRNDAHSRRLLGSHSGTSLALLWQI